MNREEIIRIARLAGLHVNGHTTEERRESCERFASLVAAVERKACDQIVHSECIGFADDDAQLSRIRAKILARG